MSTLKTPFRYDFVGSFLRPEKLKEAKKNLKKERLRRMNLTRLLMSVSVR